MNIVEMESAEDFLRGKKISGLNDSVRGVSFVLKE